MRRTRHSKRPQLKRTIEVDALVQSIATRKMQSVVQADAGEDEEKSRKDPLPTGRNN